MRKEEEDLKAILDLMLEWCRTYGHDYVSAFAKDYGFANGITDPDEDMDKRVNISIFPEEIPADGAAGKSK
jgi:hypothetical protein